MRRTTPWTALFTALALAPAAAGQAGKGAATPEEAVAAIAQAFRAGDIEAILGRMAEPYRTFHRAHGEAVMDREALRQALDDRFGKPAGAVKPPSFRDSLRAIQRVEVYARLARADGKVQLTVWLTEERMAGKPHVLEQRWLAAKGGAGWELEVPVGGGAAKKVALIGPDGKEVEVYRMPPPPAPPDPREVAYARKVMPQYRAALEKATRQVREGAFKARADAERAVGEALRAVEAANPPPMLEKQR